LKFLNINLWVQVTNLNPPEFTTKAQSAKVVFYFFKHFYREAGKYVKHKGVGQGGCGIEQKTRRVAGSF
jgi:hypothetical protein